MARFDPHWGQTVRQAQHTQLLEEEVNPVAPTDPVPAGTRRLRAMRRDDMFEGLNFLNNAVLEHL